MTTPKRHQAGEPASRGGQFAADPKFEATTELVDATKPYRDLGVVGDLEPYTGRDADIPAGAVSLTSEGHRQLVLSVANGEVTVFTPIEDIGYGQTTSGDTSVAGVRDLVSGALSAAAAHDLMSNVLSIAEEEEFEHRDTELRMQGDGSLATDIMVLDEDGEYREITFNHATEELTVSYEGQALDEKAASEFLGDVGEHLLEDGDWTTAFRKHAARAAADVDVSIDIRVAASNVTLEEWAN